MTMESILVDRTPFRPRGCGLTPFRLDPCGPSPREPELSPAGREASPRPRTAGQETDTRIPIFKRTDATKENLAKIRSFFDG